MTRLWLCPVQPVPGDRSGIRSDTVGTLEPLPVLGGNWDSRPDLDNCAKALFDACNRLAYRDDQQVVQQVTDIVPATGKPCVEFTVYIIRRGSTR